MNTEIRRHIHTLWDYQLMHHTLQKSDSLLVLGSHDLRVAAWAAQLYLQGWAPRIIFSGGLGRLTEGRFASTEAELFAEVARGMGVPQEHILLETRSANTGENIQFTGQLLQEKGLILNSFIVVQKPYMERRAYATFKKHWPEKACVITSPPLSFENYCQTDDPDISEDSVAHLLVGDLQRIRVYAEKGFQIPQPIPEQVWEACQQLIVAGYTKHLVAE